MEPSLWHHVLQLGLLVSHKAQVSNRRPQKLLPLETKLTAPGEEPSPFPEVSRCFFRMHTPGHAAPRLSLPVTSGLVLFHPLLLAVVAGVGLQPLGGGALLEGQHLLRPVPQGPVICKGKVAPWGQASGPGNSPGHGRTPPADPCQVPPQPKAKPLLTTGAPHAWLEAQPGH